MAFGPLLAPASVAAAPLIGGFTPSQGPVGTLVTIEGDGFLGATQVTFGEIASQFTIFDTHQIVATVPTGAVSGPIAVVTPGGRDVSPAVFTVTLNQAPTITSFSPGSGPAGTEVSINGQNMSGATAVRFNGVPASFHEGFGGANLVATVPVNATSGNITVVTPFGELHLGLDLYGDGPRSRRHHRLFPGTRSGRHARGYQRQ